MAHFDLEEQEQLDSIKTWWKMYGNLVTTVISVLAVVVVGWQGWKIYQGNQVAQASAIYSMLEDAIAVKDAQRIKMLTGELTEKYAGTQYAVLGAMAASKATFLAGDLKTARLQLTWAVDNAKHELKDVARLRLVAVLLDDKAYDEALKQLQEPHAPAFDMRFHEMKGEVLLAQGKKDEAQKAFKAALASFDEKQKAEKEAAHAGKDKDDKAEKEVEEAKTQEELARAPYRELLQQKIDALGEKS